MVYFESCIVVCAKSKKVNPISFYLRKNTHNLCHLTVSNQFVPKLVRHLPCSSGFVLHIPLFIIINYQFLTLASLTNTTSEFSTLWLGTDFIWESYAVRKELDWICVHLSSSPVVHMREPSPPPPRLLILLQGIVQDIGRNPSQVTPGFLKCSIHSTVTQELGLTSQPKDY